MGTRYIKARVLVQNSAASDYSRADKHEASETLTATETVTELQVAAAAGGGQALDLDYLTDADNILFENCDASSAVTFSFDTVSGVTCEFVVPAGQWVKICEWDPSFTIVLVGATGGESCKLSIW